MNLGGLGLAGSVFFLAWWFTRVLWLPTSRLYLLDRPNERSLHVMPTPRTGGLAVLGSLAIGWLAAYLSGLRAAQVDTSLWVMAMTIVIGAVSFWDDRAGLPPGLRFGIHAVAAGAVVWRAGLTVKVIAVPVLGTLSLGWAAMPATILFLIWMTNLYNFMDGMDGFAGGMTVLGFGFLGYIAWAGGHRALALLSLLILGAAAGFLVYNLPPAKIFMGDVGSVSLGFLAGTLALMGSRDGLFDLFVPGLIFSPFIVDATVTLGRRLLRGEKVWQAHREHYYQRLVLAGWGHRKTVFAEYWLMLACGTSAIGYTQLSETGRLALLLVWVLIYSVLAFAVRMVEQRHRG